MAASSRDPKALSEWVELDYHGRPRGLKRLRGRLTRYVFYGLLVLLGASVAASLSIGFTSRIYQAAPLASAHASFNSDCAACHTTPFRTALRFSPFHSGVHAVKDAACKTCHSDKADTPSVGKLPGPMAVPHNAIVLDEPNCAECHVEHRGRQILARVPDSDCIACHADLTRHRPAGASPFKSVTGFPSGHPEFALWRGDHKGLKDGKEDPGKIQFGHKHHLALDDPRFLLGKGKLTCAQCHEPDDSGRYMRPINHERHCLACHQGQRTVQLLGRFLDPEDQQAANDFAKEPVPHLRPEAIHDSLNGRLLNFLARNPVDIGKEEDLGRCWPQPKGMLIWAKFPGRMASYHRERFVPPQLEHLEHQLYDLKGGCAFCHEQKPASWPEAGRPAAVLPEYEEPNIPKRWLRHGAFNHERHLMVDCVKCHDAVKSERTADVLMPKLEVCASCHSPTGGARYDCAECHKYHGREAIRAGAHTFPFQEKAKR